MKCSEEDAMLIMIVERERNFQCLARLNVEYAQGFIQVLGNDLPSLDEVFSIIRTEEGRRNITLDSPASESSAIATIKSHLNNHSGSTSKINLEKGEPSKTPSNKDGLWYTYCKKPRHTKETRWTLHEKPQFYGKNGGN